MPRTDDETTTAPIDQYRAATMLDRFGDQDAHTLADPDGFRNATVNTEELLARLMGQAPDAQLVSQVLESVNATAQRFDSYSQPLDASAALLVTFHELYPRRQDSQALTQARLDELVALTGQLLGYLVDGQVEPGLVRAAFGFHLYTVVETS